MVGNQFDDFLKQKLDNYSSAVPGDMWERIREEGTKKPTVFWWKSAGFGIILLAVFATGIYLQKENSSSLSKGINTSNLTNKVAQLNENKSPRQEGKIVDDTKNDTKNKSTVAEEISPAELLVVKDRNSAANQINASIVADKEITTTPIYLDHLHQKFSVSSKSTSAKKNSKSSISGTDNELISHQNFVRSGVPPFKFLAYQDKEAQEKSLNKEALKNIASALLIDCPPSYANRRKDWYLEIFASPDYAFKSVLQYPNNQNYLQRKDSTEQFQTAFTAGVRISKSIGERLLLKTGLQYSQINERFKYTVVNERRLITVITVHTIIRIPGDTVIVRDTSTAEQIGYRNTSTKNRYRSLDIPVVFAYEWGNEKWKANLNAGVIFNLYSWQKGEMLDTSYQPVAFGKNTTTIFKQNIGLGLYAGLSFLKPINERTEWFAEPYFRYNLSNVTKEQSPFTQKVHLAGINLGIRYKINGNRQR